MKHIYMLLSRALCIIVTVSRPKIDGRLRRKSALISRTTSAEARVTVCHRLFKTTMMIISSRSLIADIADKIWARGWRPRAYTNDRIMSHAKIGASQGTRVIFYNNSVNGLV